MRVWWQAQGKSDPYRMAQAHAVQSLANEQPPGAPRHQ